MTDAERPMDRHFQHLADRAEREERAARVALRRAQDARREIEHRRRAESDRFNIELPTDPYLLDVLACIDVEPGSVWRWRGKVNNKGTAVLRGSAGLRTSERTVARYLALTLKVLERHEFGLLYPSGDTDDVNPWHRVLRQTEGPNWNAHRFGPAVKVADQDPGVYA